MKRRFDLTKDKITEIVRKELRKLLKESREISNIVYKNHTLSIKQYFMSDSDDKEFIVNNKDVIWNILQSAYENLGGFNGFQTKRDMLKKSPFFTLGFCDDVIITVTVYNTYLGGNKCVGAACVKDENHENAVKLLEMIMEHNISNWNEWVWLEASGKIEEMCKKLNGFNVPSEYVVIYLGNKQYSIIDEYHYTRKIGGNDETKTIFGLKNQETFEFLKEQINSKIIDFLNNVNSKRINEEDERDRIWSDFSQKLSEIDKVINIINYFVYLKDDELINEFPKESINILKKAIKTAEELISNNQYSNEELFRYNNCIEDGYRVLNTSTVLSTLKMSA